LNIKISILGILGLLIIVIGVSGCTSNVASFNQSGMFFSYPADNYTFDEVNTSAPMTVSLNGTGKKVSTGITVSKSTTAFKSGLLTFSNSSTYDGINYNFYTLVGGLISTSSWDFEKNGNYYDITDYGPRDFNATEMIMRTLN